MTQLATTSLRERQLLLPDKQLKNPSLIRWIVGAVFGGVTTSALIYKGIGSFTPSRKTDAFIFGAGAVLCLGTCIYCCYRFVTSLKSRNVEPIPPSFNEEAAKADNLMLKKIDDRLKELLPPEEDLESADQDLPLHDSIARQLTKLETLLPELGEEISSLQAALQKATLRKSAPSSPSNALDSSAIGNGSIEDDNSEEEEALKAVRARLETLAKKVNRNLNSANSSRTNSVANSPNRSLASPSPGPTNGSKSKKRVAFESPNGSINNED